MKTSNIALTQGLLREWSAQGFSSGDGYISTTQRVETYGSRLRVVLDFFKLGDHQTTLYGYNSATDRNADVDRPVNVGSIVYGETNGPLAFWSGSAWTADAFSVATALRAALSGFASSLIIADGVPIPGPPGTTDFNDLTDKPTTLEGYGVDLLAEPFALPNGTQITVGSALTEAAAYQPMPAARLTTPSLRLRQEIWAYELVEDPEDRATCTPKLNEMLDTCRSWKVRARFEAKTYMTNAALDVSGLTVSGVMGGFLNSQGTVIEADGDYPVMEQANAQTPDIGMNIGRLHLRGGSTGLRLRYVVNSVFSQIAVTDTYDGIEFGNDNDVGGVFNKFSQIWTDVLGIGFALNGNSYANANEVELSYLKGGEFGATVDLQGGIGAVSNKFRSTEFVGPRYGVGLLGANKGTDFDACYFESFGPAILVSATTLALNVRNSTFSILENTNPTGKNAFIYHNGGFLELSVEGGYIYLPNLPAHNGLYFVASENLAMRDLYMARPPTRRDVYATGFVLNN